MKTRCRTDGFAGQSDQEHSHNLNIRPVYPDRDGKCFDFLDSHPPSTNPAFGQTLHLMGKNFVWADKGRLSIAVHNAKPPSDLEWTRFLNHVRSRKDITDQRILVWTDGGSPDAHQRRALEEVIRKHIPDPAPMAVLTSSLIVRAVMKLASFFNPLIKCYAPDESSSALAYLGLSPDERAFVSRQLAELRKQVAPAQGAA